ncbi:MAG: epoxyqueuosine reductase [Peptococcaceae bacterium]|nr:epoxyqueuosine reductase [Peptococcaceae bacterium]
MELRILADEITGFVDNSQLNTANEIGLNRIFDYPIIGVADAKDPMFVQLQNPDVIGPHHLLPSDWLNNAKSVISYFLPFSKEVRQANSEHGLPAIEWVYGRIEGEQFNNALRNHIVDIVNQNGGKAIAPAVDSRFSVVGTRSNWSERHIAYIAGLGTFGLSKSLITKKGCAGRFGSVVLDVQIPPTLRDYKEIYDYCTMCGECIRRCPSTAITQQGKNDSTCSKYIGEEILPRFTPRYGCGKCQTAVPCEFGLP